MSFLLLTCSLALLLCGARAAQAATPWSGIIAPLRATDWTQAGARGTVLNATTICQTLQPGVTAAQINAAIAACSSAPGPVGTPAKVVKLAAGTYNLNPGIDFAGNSNVLLEGDGADKTLLVITGGGAPCHNHYGNICLAQTNNETNWDGGPSNTANWTAGYAQGTTNITLSAVPNLKVGYMLFLDQADDAADTGSIFVCDDNTISPPCSLEGNTGNSQRTHRNQRQIVTVVSCGTATTFGAACNGTNVTITPGLRMNTWRASQSPGAWWPTSPLFNSGVANLSIDGTKSAGAEGIVHDNCIDCVTRGVRVIGFGKAGNELAYSARSSVLDSYFYLNQTNQTSAYASESFGTSDSLIQNNIFQYSAGPLMFNSDCSGCVAGYNFLINEYYTGSSGWSMPGSSQHTAGTEMLLYEGNVGAQSAADNFHGTHNLITEFRNYWTGTQVKCWISGTYPNATFGACNNDRLAVMLRSYSRFYNFVGNVLGTQGINTSYLNNSSEDATIYSIGNGNTEGSVTVPNDPLVSTTLFRWGNFDVVNAANRFLASEVPSGIGTYANPVPASQALPPSFYLNAKPSWWRSMPWPGIGPDVTGGNISGVAGHAYMNPAQDCYMNAMNGPADGTGPVLTFNATNCYGTSTTTPPPPPPTTSVCDVNGDGSVNVADVQGEVNQALGASACANDINQDGVCNVIDVQRVVNAALGGTCATTP